MRDLLAAIVAVQLTASPANAAAPGELPIFFEYNGARLGMTKEAWRAVPVLPSARKVRVSGGAPVSAEQMWCTDEFAPNNEPFAGLVLNQMERSLNVISCEYGALSMVGASQMFTPSYVLTGWGAAGFVVYQFLDNRLFHISIDTEKDTSFSVIQGLTAEYGSPIERSLDHLRSGQRLAAQNSVLVWLSQATSIQVDASFRNDDKVHIDYTVVEAADRVQAQGK